MSNQKFQVPTSTSKITEKGPALIFAPHPDDEVFGCAGAIMRHLKQHDPVKVVILTDGSKAINNIKNITEYVELRKQESIQAAKFLGYESPIFWNLPDQGIEYSEKLIQKVINCLLEYKPGLVYAPSLWEYHPDHYNLGNICLEAVRRIKKDLFLAMYEVGTPLRPNFFLDITDLVSKKYEAIQVFKSQLQLNNYLEHIQALNTIRTYTLPTSVRAAEAYFLISDKKLREIPLSPELSLQLNLQQDKQEEKINELKEKVFRTEGVIREKDEQIAQILSSTSWKITKPIRILKSFFVYLQKFPKTTWKLAKIEGRGIKGPAKLTLKTTRMFKHYDLKTLLSRIKFHLELDKTSKSNTSVQLSQNQINKTDQLQMHTKPVDIIIYVHNSFENIKKCLKSLLRHTTLPYNIILIDDGSKEQTRIFLEDFAQSNHALLHRNKSFLGYTFAANQGLRQSTSEYAILLDSSTIFTPNWLDRLVACAASDESIGLVGPLNNNFSCQSMSDYETNRDWPGNFLPENIDLEEISRLTIENSCFSYPEVPFLNRFCLLVKKKVIEDIGYFDQENFGDGYGMGNDYCLRAKKRGWKIVLADDVYIYYLNAMNYSTEKLKQLYQKEKSALEKKHELNLINSSIDYCLEDRVLEGLQARTKHIFEIRELIKKGRELWTGKSIIFILPVIDAGGGSNVIISEAEALKKMGVSVHILNFENFKNKFQSSYPNLDIPVDYVKSKEDIPKVASTFDAAIATFNHSVQWLVSLSANSHTNTILGYYIQDYEPYFYHPESPEYRKACESYSLIPEMVLFCKTKWNSEIIKAKTGLTCRIVGPSFNLKLFKPEPRLEPLWPQRSLRIVAMIRPSCPRRNPVMTMQVLEVMKKKYGQQIEVITFGQDENDPQLKSSSQKFEHRQLGKQSPASLARLFNESDIFVDFSTYQAMGLTGLEAMSCGMSVILPKEGGVHSYAQNNKNALLVDTSQRQECQDRLEQLIQDHELRARLQQQAIHDVAEFYPEKSAFNMLQTIFTNQLS